MKIRLARAGAWCAVVALSGCLSNDVVDSGQFALWITDAPVDGVEKVVVQFSGVDLNSEEGTESVTFAKPLQLDLLEYSNGRVTTLLDTFSVVAGDYRWVRLRVDTAGANDSYVQLPGGNRYELTIERNDGIGIRIEQPFTVPKNDAVTFAVDFDLRKSLRESGGGYTLVPQLRLVNLAQAGSIRGGVDADFMALDGCDSGAVVYAYAGDDSPLSDITGGVQDPVTTSRVERDPTSSDAAPVYQYQLSYLPEGVYTVALTCDAELDAPTVDEAISFLVLQEVNAVPYRYYNATVNANTTTYVTLTCPDSVCSVVSTQ